MILPSSAATTPTLIPDDDDVSYVHPLTCRARAFTMVPPRRVEWPRPAGDGGQVHAERAQSTNTSLRNSGVADRHEVPSFALLRYAARNSPRTTRQVLMAW